MSSPRQLLRDQVNRNGDRSRIHVNSSSRHIAAHARRRCSWTVASLCAPLRAPRKPPVESTSSGPVAATFQSFLESADEAGATATESRASIVIMSVLQTELGCDQFAARGISA